MRCGLRVWEAFYHRSRRLTTETRGHRENRRQFWVFNPTLLSSLCPCASVVSTSVPSRRRPLLLDELDALGVHVVRAGEQVSPHAGGGGQIGQRPAERLDHQPAV